MDFLLSRKLICHLEKPLLKREFLIDFEKLGGVWKHLISSFTCWNRNSNIILRLKVIKKSIRMMHFCISLKWNSMGSRFVSLTSKSIILVYTRWIFRNYTRSRTDFSILKKIWHSQSYKSVRFTGGSKNSSKVLDLRKTKNSFEINRGFQVRLCKLIEVWAL